MCGCAVIGRSDRRYCSGACRQRSFRARHAERHAETVRQALRQLHALESMMTGPFLRPYLQPLHAATSLLSGALGKDSVLTKHAPE